MKRMLLFIDDNSTLLHILSKSFSEFFDVVGFDSSEDAMRYIQSNSEKLDIILSDYKMPNYNGIEVLAKAKSLKASTVRILFTAYSDVDEVKKSTSVYDAVIEKNVLKDTNEIIRVIQDVSDRKVKSFSF